MFSITLKRSAATLGVVAGLLAAAAPASAMPIYMKFDDVAVVSRPDQTAQTLHHEGAKDTDALIDYEGTSFDVKAAVSFGAGKDRGLGRAGFNNWTEGNDQPMQDTEARVEGEMQLEDISLGIRGDAQDTQASRTRSLKDTMISGYNGKAAAEGTQVGSEGVKDDVPLETVSFTIKGAADRGEVTGLEPTVKAPVVVLTGANDYGWTEGNDQPCRCDY